MADKNDNNGTSAKSEAPGKEDSQTGNSVSIDVQASSTDLSVGLSERALAAGGRKGMLTPKGDKRSITPFGTKSSISLFAAGVTGIAKPEGKYLVIGDGVLSPFMALCLRVHGIECDLAHHAPSNDIDKGTITLTPSITQLMGDILQVSVPSGSVIGRILIFDHVGNDMCDLDLNEFREKGESPTFFCCDRPKIEQSLLSLCKAGAHSCTVMPKATIEKGGMHALEKGVRVTLSTGVQQDYLGVICTARNQALVPELTLTNEELQRKEENSQRIKEESAQAHRWLEVCIPPLPELKKFETRFTPGSQEIVEITTPRNAKLSVRPTMLATKLFYNITLSIPDSATDPRLKSTSMKTFWDDTIEHWTAGVPGYVSHTLFRPLFSHIQQHFHKNSALVMRTPSFVLPHWSEGEGRLIKVGNSVHQSCFDAVDVSDAQGFSDCWMLARTLSTHPGSYEELEKFLTLRRLQVTEELDHHQILTNYTLKERSMFRYAGSRFMMKMMRRYKRSWRGILNNYITVLPRTLAK